MERKVITDGTYTIINTVDISDAKTSEYERDVQARIDMVRLACQTTNSLAGALAHIDKNGRLHHTVSLPKPWHNLTIDQQLAIIETDFPNTQQEDLLLIQQHEAYTIDAHRACGHTAPPTAAYSGTEKWREIGDPFLTTEGSHYTQPWCRDQQWRHAAGWYNDKDSDPLWTFKRVCWEVGRKTKLALVSYESEADNPCYILCRDLSDMLGINKFWSTTEKVIKLLPQIMDLLDQAEARAAYITNLCQTAVDTASATPEGYDKLQEMFQDIIPHWCPGEDDLWLLVNGVPYEIDYPKNMR